MKTILTTDWAPHIERAARRIAPVLVAVYCLGWAFGKWLHRLNDRLAGRSTSAPAPQPVITQRQAAVATPANIAPPVLIHISDPMARAVRMVRSEGKSQRLAASLCGVSRSSLQRALKA
jgi:DNA-directed RNA polymerase specialized sigma24 family protein